MSFCNREVWQWKNNIFKFLVDIIKHLDGFLDVANVICSQVGFSMSVHQNNKMLYIEKLENKINMT